jgi:dephospho-CoA kinase
MNKPLKIGIAGYMGAGKSTCTRLLAHALAPDVEIIDADTEAKRLIQSDPGIIRSLSDAFGSSVYSPDEAIDFGALGKAAFADVENLKLFNSIVHPKVIAYIIQRLKACDKKYCLCDAALIPLWHIENQFDMLIWISSMPEVRLHRRHTEKIQMSLSSLRTRMELQEAILQEPAHAPWRIIYNNGTNPGLISKLLNPFIEELLQYPEHNKQK